MKRAGPAVLFLLLAVACGKVGDPKPPIVRVPQAVQDLKVTQSGYHVTLTWTNPANYVDGNPATDLATVRILRNEAPVAAEPALPAGQVQTKEIDITNDLDTDMNFSVKVISKRGKSSGVSNAATIHTRNVPGSPRDLKLVVDQRVITLDWKPPEGNADLVDGYLVIRADRPEPVFVQAPPFKDSQYEEDKTYKYTVFAVRDIKDRILGSAGAPGDVLAKDTRPPATPTGLRFETLDMGILLLQWNANTEEDLKGYLVLRSDQTEPVFTSRAAFSDSTYRSGMGITYRLLAEDTFENKSDWTAPQAP